VGKKFTEYIQEEIFEHAGMNDSGYFATDQLPERTAYANINNDDGSWRTNFFTVPIVGAPDGGAYVTAPDMVRFWNALSQHEFFGIEMTEKLLCAQISTSLKAPYTNYGYGVWLERQNNRTKKYFVEGYDPGVALRSAVYPKDTILTVIGNTADALWPVYDILEESLELI
jgi:CubicO group peptidase (beta-lactamase class C family)